MKTATLICLFSTILFGCSSSAQLVRKDPSGGRIVLEGAFMPAMGEARLMMAEYCDGRFDATERGEAVEFRCRQRPVRVGSVQVAVRDSAEADGLEF